MAKAATEEPAHSRLAYERLVPSLPRAPMVPPLCSARRSEAGRRSRWGDMGGTSATLTKARGVGKGPRLLQACASNVYQNLTANAGRRPRKRAACVPWGEGREVNPVVQVGEDPSASRVHGTRRYRHAHCPSNSRIGVPDREKVELPATADVGWHRETVERRHPRRL